MSVKSLILAVVFLVSLNSISDHDTGYHLANGKYIVNSGNIPTQDIFSYTEKGSLWINHYWLSDSLFYLIYLLSGTWGLIIGCGLIAVLTYLFIFKIYELNNSPGYYFYSGLILIFIMLTGELWVVRPQIFTYLMLALCIFLLEKWRQTGNAKSLLFIPPLFLIWGNMHAGVISGMGILLIYLAGRSFSKKLEIKKEFLPILGGLILPFLNPNSYKTIFYNSYIGDAVKKMVTAEWLSILNYLDSWQSFSFLAILAILTLIILKDFFLEKAWLRSEEYPPVILSLIGFALPFYSIRHVGLAPILYSPAISKIFLKYENKLSEDSRYKAKQLMVLFSCLLVLGFSFRVIKMPPINTNALPVGAANYIIKNNISGKGFAPDNFGGMLAWKLWPSQEIFADGRSELFGGKTGDELICIMTNNNCNRLVLIEDKYSFNYLVLQQSGYYRQMSLGLYRELVEKGKYFLVHWDDGAIVLLKNSPENENLIRRDAYFIINPFITTYPEITEEEYKIVMNEIYKAIKREPASVQINNLAKLFYDNRKNQ